MHACWQLLEHMRALRGLPRQAHHSSGLLSGERWHGWLWWRRSLPDREAGMRPCRRRTLSAGELLPNRLLHRAHRSVADPPHQPPKTRQKPQVTRPHHFRYRGRRQVRHRLPRGQLRTSAPKRIAAPTPRSRHRPPAAAAGGAARFRHSRHSNSPKLHHHPPARTLRPLRA